MKKNIKTNEEEKKGTFDSKVRVVRKPKVCKEFWVYLSFEQGKRRKIDYVCELVDRFNRIQNLNYHGTKSNV